VTIRLPCGEGVIGARRAYMAAARRRLGGRPSTDTLCREAGAIQDPHGKTSDQSHWQVATLPAPRRPRGSAVASQEPSEPNHDKPICSDRERPSCAGSGQSDVTKTGLVMKSVVAVEPLASATVVPSAADVSSPKSPNDQIAATTAGVAEDNVCMHKEPAVLEFEAALEFAPGEDGAGPGFFRVSSGDRWQTPISSLLRSLDLRLGWQIQIGADRSELKRMPSMRRLRC
jgi:hypothetical protein